MRMFISWSGPTSQQVAEAIYDWFPSVLQVVTPYISSEDIDKGSRWSIELARELESSSYGIICVTPDNMAAPWLNFEAGALSKALDSSRVSPFLFNVRKSELTGPLAQFQATSYERDDVRRLMLSVNESYGENALPPQRLNQVFEVWWPRLEERLNSVTALRKPGKSDEEERGQGEILEEVLELVRGQQRLISSPETLLPRDYLQAVLPQIREPQIVRDSGISVHGEPRNYDRVIAARASFANGQLLCVSASQDLKGITHDLQTLFNWADSNQFHAARCLISPFLLEQAWLWLDNFKQRFAAKGLRFNDQFAIRVLSEPAARAIGDARCMVVDSEVAAIFSTLIGGGLITEDETIVRLLSRSFHRMWATSKPMQEFAHLQTERAND